MATFDLTRLLAPKRIAIVGGGKWAEGIIGAAERIGFGGDIIPVHPKAKRIGDRVAVAHVSEIAGPVDAAFVAVNRQATTEVVGDLSALGAGGAVCFASGYSEAKAEAEAAEDLQDALVAAAGNMPILGPNCYGFVNALDRAAIWPDQHGMTPVEAGVAILTQSSNIAINMTMQERGLPIACTVTCGNAAQLSQPMIARHLLNDPRISALGLHVEGFSDLAAWHALAMDAERMGKSVVVLKVGRSAQARAATVSHTASLAGSDAGAQALIERLGFARVDDIPTFLEALKLLHFSGKPAHPSIATISCSGGEASLAADCVSATRLSLPELSETQRTELRTALGPMVALANPLDYHTYIWRDVPTMTAAWSAMAEGAQAMTLAIVDYPRTDAEDWSCATQAAINTHKATGRPFGVVATLPELMPRDKAEELGAGGVLAFNGLREAVVAIDACAHVTPPAPEAPWLARDIEPVELIGEAEAKQVLAGSGVAVPGHVEISADEYAPPDFAGPYVVKSTGLAHKSDQGGVRLGVAKAGLKDAMNQMPGETFLVEELIEGSVAELLVGVLRDPAHGFVMTLGAGGVLTELMEDKVSFLLPASREVVAASLARLRTYKLLEGYRGKPAGDIEALVETLMNLQTVVERFRDRIDEMEVNPLIVTPDRVVAVDALMRLEPERN